MLVQLKYKDGSKNYFEIVEFLYFKGSEPRFLLHRAFNKFDSFYLDINKIESVRLIDLNKRFDER